MFQKDSFSRQIIREIRLLVKGKFKLSLQVREITNVVLALN
jgi:hypothetical protein